MQNIQYYTEGQRKFLYESLRDQKSPMTPAEKKLYKELREYFSIKVEVCRCYNPKNIHGLKVLYIDGYVKEFGMDTFGDVYRFGWCKVKTTSKGSYYTSHYLGHRVYLDL